MKLIILRNNLAEGIAAIERAVGANANLSVLRGILFAATGNRIVLTATNLELAVQAVIPGKVIQEGTLIVPFGIFSTIVKNLNAERVSLDQDGTKLSVTTDNYTATIQCVNGDDFPIIPSVQSGAGEIRLQAETLASALGSVAVAAQYSEIRPEISGVYAVLSEGTLTLAATDSFRLAERKLTANEFSATIESTSFIIPLRTVEEVLRIFSRTDDEVRIAADQSQVLFETPTRRLISRLIDGRFPEYHAIIPKSTSTTASVSRGEFIDALRLTSSFSGRANDITVSAGEGKRCLELTSADAIIGESQYQVPTKLKGDRFSIVFNWRYLLDGFKIFSGNEVTFGVNATGPVTITDQSNPTLLYILMPIKA
jgi:DNA polymerase III subunit beta